MEKIDHMRGVWRLEEEFWWRDVIRRTSYRWLCEGQQFQIVVIFCYNNCWECKVHYADICGRWFHVDRQTRCGCVDDFGLKGQHCVGCYFEIVKTETWGDNFRERFAPWSGEVVTWCGRCVRWSRSAPKSENI